MLPELHCHRMLPCALKLSLTCLSWTSVFPPFARWIVDADMRNNWLQPDGIGLESVGRVFQRHGLCFWLPLGPKAGEPPSRLIPRPIGLVSDLLPNMSWLCRQSLSQVRGSCGGLHQWF